ncbi:MAG: hypothetical protein DRP42_00080 [Tenericutes bacterium]|nr:MAG: hypothetical protein DRP42_00080 [Mycoplasmatota bacterium]
MSNFQARRMNTRFKTNGEKELVYTLNGSSLAVERTFAAIIENYYDNGKIMIPDVLQKYLDFKEI